MSEAPVKPSEGFADLQAGVDFDDGLGELDSPGIARGKEKQGDLRSVDAEPRDGQAADDDIQIVIDDTPTPKEPQRQVARKQNDDDDYSRGVRERIARERRVTQAERNARLALEKELVDTRKERDELRTKFGDTEIQSLTQQLREARANADTEKETELLAKIAEAGARRGAPKPATQQTAIDDGLPPNEALQAWVQANPWWNSDDPKYAARRAKVLAINAELYQGGDDEYSPDYYAEIDRRMAEEEGQEPPPRRDTRQSAPQPRPARGVAGGGEGGGAPRNGGNGRSVTITREDKEQMRRFKLDPGNPAHLKQWAKQKRALA